MDSFFFYFSKLIWRIISPDSLFVLSLLLVCLLLLLHRDSTARRLVYFVCFSALLLTLYPLGNWLLWPLEQQYQANPTLPQKIDGIMVLGGSIEPLSSFQHQQIQLNETAERLSQFVSLARRYPESKLLFSGGNSSLDSTRPSEAEFARDYFAEAGLDVSRILFEEDAKNTFQNVKLSQSLIQAKEDEQWVVITSALHMPRAMAVFCRFNWPVIAYPVDFRSEQMNWTEPRWNLAYHLKGLKVAVHEWLGVWVYDWSGKSKAAFSGACI